MTATALHRCWSPAMFQPSGRPCLATARSRVSRRGADNTSKTTPFSLGLPSSREGCSPQTTRPSAGLRLGCLAALGCLLLAGCASVKMPAGLRGEFSRKQQQREQQAIHQFEQHRDLAEYQAAVHCWQRGDEKACREQLEKLLARNPRHTAARLLLADVYLAQERYADALEQAQRVLAHSPENAEAHYMMGLVLDARGDFADALEHYRRAVEIEPEEEIYRLGYALALEAAEKEAPSVADATRADIVGLENTSSPGSATASVPGASRSVLHCLPPPPDVAAEPLQTESLHHTDGIRPAGCADCTDLNDWVDSARGKSDLAPTACPAVATVGDAQAPGMACAASFDFPASPASVHLPSGSATVAATLPAGLPEAVSNLLKRAREELRCGREAEAEALLREACSIHPHNPQIPVGAGVMALGYGRPGLAWRILTDVKDRFSDCPAISRLLGVACYRLGDFSGAEAALRHALSLDNSSALSYFLLGCTLAKLGQRESAEECFRQARRLDPRYGVRLQAGRAGAA